MPPKPSKGESKQGLVITLVFFILATIGLGVATYFGFADQTEKEKLAAKAAAEKTDREKDRDWYKFQAWQYRAYLGETENIKMADLGTLKEQFDSGSLGSKASDKADVEKVIKKFDDKKWFSWNRNEKKPDRTFEDILKEKDKQYEALKKQFDTEKTARAAAEKRAKEADELKAKTETDFLAKFNELKKKSNDDLTGDRQKIDELRNEVNRLGGEVTAARNKAAADQKALEARIAKAGKDLDAMKNLVKRRDEEIGQLKLKSTEAPPSMRTDWRIVRMDPRGTNPYINLGSADKVRPQLTFSIHGVTLDGRPIQEAKGTLEVVNVIGDHLSQTRITSVKDPNRDPILRGDVLYNPSWNPTLKKHVALAGIMDLTGDGRDSLHEFMRNLARQNIVVDAYLDPKDNQVKGKITVGTDYLILGESLEFNLTGREKNTDLQKKMREGMTEMKNQAKTNGVAVIALNKYLEMIGYRLPRSVNEERPSLYNPNRRPDLAPRIGGEKPPAMPPKEKK